MYVLTIDFINFNALVPLLIFAVVVGSTMVDVAALNILVVVDTAVVVLLGVVAVCVIVGLAVASP